MDRNYFQLLLIVSRPRFWPYLVGTWIVGFAYASRNYQDSIFNFYFWAGLLIWIFPANLVLYGINDLADWDTDRRNVKKRSMEHLLQVKEREVVKFGVGVAMAIMLLFGLIFRPILEMNLIFLILAGSYSLSPFRFKAKPGLDMLSNTLYIFPGLMGYFFAAGMLPPLIIIGAATAWVMAMQLYSAIPDIVPDDQAGLKTTATVLGEKRGLLLCGFLWLVWGGLVFLYDPFLGILGGVYLVIVLLNLIRKVPVSVSYWWFPKINFWVGFILVARYWL